MGRLTFAKMHSSGNDFIVIDNRAGQMTGDIPEMVRKLCRPHFSIGADGLILIEKPEAAGDFKWRFFNSDGSQVEMCGNGSRCAALFAYSKCIGGRRLTFETEAGIIRAEVREHSVKVQLTPPADYRSEITVGLPDRIFDLSAPDPCLPEEVNSFGARSQRLHSSRIILPGDLKAAFINTGVPHVVYFVDDVESVDVLGIGAATRYHELFAPAGTNANFVKVSGKDELTLRTYERGVEAETLACGTGATASALVAGAAGYVKPPVRVHTRGGNDLTIYFDWDGNKFGDVFLEGDAVFVYHGVTEEGALL